MNTTLTKLIVLAGVAQLSIVMIAPLIPLRLKWSEELRPLARLHRQMHWVYSGYVVLSITAFAALSIVNARELAGGSGLARGFCAYVAVFWGARLMLQTVFDARPYLTAWWLRAGYSMLTMMFALFSIVYAWAATAPGATF